MATNILLVGVGGQGIILMSKVLAAGLAQMGYDIKMSEIHGMSQRGGTVTTQIRYGDKVYAPGIGEQEADCIVSFEKVEALRALPFLKKGGTMITDKHEIYSMPVLTGKAEYPGNALELMAEAVENLHIIPAMDKALELGNVRVQNICLLGALVKVLKLDAVDWKGLLADYVPEKALDLNKQAFAAGYAMI
ncbi:MAG TPA: indolepyruvate oxidoreductase subunit beta [Bacillota bacterium]|jgi:indolepyruvate ferredoxin oxidoreductase beta subunit|nr:indolepyruvate oxidoreductase subunit beta [Bacillota bacterium]HOC05962.1 indolepyruvate oxidoreductase subunit beta [Bacillota bacterium]HPZ22840.1 indolepyruvate oxidoreductase subunit beta [Bacillota bacterium]HQD20480.1 indolepyruvate oxidoreductase subunit beta [Bacillota bacterium]